MPVDIKGVRHPLERVKKVKIRETTEVDQLRFVTFS
jgi:hypothetical protein